MDNYSAFMQFEICRPTERICTERLQLGSLNSENGRVREGIL
jgi:hypothetical protein